MTINPNWIFAHCVVVHHLAGRSKQPGKLVVTAFGEDPSQVNSKTGKPGLPLPPKVLHFDIGDPKRMSERVRELASQPHYNIYMPLAIFQPDLSAGSKGSEKDIVGCFGLVADFDDADAARWSDRLPIPPQYVLETSAGRFQVFYLFTDPVPFDIVKPVAKRLKAYATCDNGTADISHVWRVAGTLNWPNAKKINEGRATEPQLVKIVQPFEGKAIVFEQLAAALPEDGSQTAKKPRSRASRNRLNRRAPGQPHPAAVEGTPEWHEAQLALVFLPEDLQQEIRQPAEGDRSKALFRIIARLIWEAHQPDDVIENLIYAHPKGIGEKYADRDDLDEEIARVRVKTTPKPVIQIRGGALPEIVDEAEQFLIERDAQMFQRGNLIVRPGLVRVKVADGREILTTRLIPVKPHNMRERFSRVVDFQKSDSQGRWRSIDCPKEVADTYLEREGEWQLPALTRIVNTPILRFDGSVLDQPGYDPTTGLLFDPQKIIFPKLLPSPTLDDAIAALKFLKELISTFPFVDDASRSVPLSHILTALVRPSLPSAPLHAYTAPAAGSGKSMLVDIASMIATGRQTPVLAQGSTAEEFEKRLGSALLAGDPNVSIDNCEHPLGGELLCQILTQPSVNIRLLGQSKNVDVLTNATISATGNNLRIVGDMTRRALVSYLDPKVERPELREFDVNPIKLIRGDRGRYAMAALTILRAYHVVGRPQQAKPLGSFEDWSRWVRDALIWLGEVDPCSTIERARHEDPQLDRLRAVVHHWKEALGERQISAAEIVVSTAPASAMDDNKVNALRDALLAVAGAGNLVDVRRLGNWLARNKDVVVDGMKIVSAGIRSGTNFWQLLSGAGG